MANAEAQQAPQPSIEARIRQQQPGASDSLSTIRAFQRIARDTIRQPVEHDARHFAAKSTTHAEAQRLAICAIKRRVGGKAIISSASRNEPSDQFTAGATLPPEEQVPSRCSLFH